MEASSRAVSALASRRLHTSPLGSNSPRGTKEEDHTEAHRSQRNDMAVDAATSHIAVGDHNATRNSQCANACPPIAANNSAPLRLCVRLFAVDSDVLRSTNPRETVP